MRREHMLVGSPNHHDVVERRMSMALEFALASCLEAPSLSGDSEMPSAGPLCAEVCKYVICWIQYATAVTKLLF